MAKKIVTTSKKTYRKKGIGSFVGDSIYAPSPFDYAGSEVNGKPPYSDYTELAKAAEMGDEGSTVVNIDTRNTPSETLMDDALVQNLEDGSTIVTLGDSPLDFAAKQIKTKSSESPQDHNENLAEYIDETYLNALAIEIIDLAESDETSAEPWRRRMEEGLKIIGIVPPGKNELPFKGASTITHPLISEAVVQFNARAYPELLPPGGPVKAVVLGKDNEEKREKAERVEKHMNYQITVEDECYEDEMDQLLFYLPLAGSAFKKTYYDDELEYTTSRFVRAENVLMPYNATSFESTPRFAIKEKMHNNDVQRYIASGMWRDVDLTQPIDEVYDSQSDNLQSTYDIADGKQSVSLEKSPRHTIIESYIYRDIKGFEGDVPLPWIVTVEKESSKVLAVRRGWRITDKKKRRRKYLTHYKYLPGLGIYGFGLVHAIGGIAESCTGSLRALLDAASFATLQGGFKSKDAKFPAGEYELQPGQWLDVNLTAEELKNAFFVPPFKEPSEALFKLLQMMEENGRRYAGTTETVVGDSPANGPVGTTVALIEQGTKVMSGIHRRLHRAQGKEFRIRAEINAEYLPENEIYFHTASGSERISAADYSDEQVFILPVSDPNIVSTQQKIAQDQAIMQLANENPELYNKERIHDKMLRDLGVSNPDEFLNKQEEIPRCDPITEGARIMAGKGAKVFQDQDHEAHYAVHMAQIEFYKTLPDNMVVQQLTMKMMEHLAKHKAYELYNQMQQMSGTVLPPLDLYADDGDSTNQIPPEIENAISKQAAQFMAQTAQYFTSRIPPSPAQEKQMQIQAEAQAKAHAAGVKARFSESKAAQDLAKGGWDIAKLQSDIGLGRQNASIALMNAQLSKEKNELKKQELQQKIVDTEMKRDAALGAKTAEVSSGRATIDNFLNTADKVVNAPDDVYESATGTVSSVLPTYDQDVADFEETLKTLSSQAFLSQVPSMKGLGALTEAEGKKLEASLANLSLRQSPEKLRANVQEAQRLMLKARSTLSDKFGVPDVMPDRPAAQEATEAAPTAPQGFRVLGVEGQ